MTEHLVTDTQAVEMWDWCERSFSPHVERLLVTRTVVMEALEKVDDLLRRLSEWDAWNPPDAGSDGPYWLREIAACRPSALLAEAHGEASA